MNNKIIVYCVLSFVVGMATGFGAKVLYDKQNKGEVYYPSPKSSVPAEEKPEEKIVDLDKVDPSTIIDPDEDIFDVPEIDPDDLNTSEELTKLHAEERHDEPYTISSDDYYQTNPHYDKRTIVYYERDDILADENEEVITDIASVVGDDFRDFFGASSGDKDIAYIRNPKFGADYEVIRLDQYYAVTVMGKDMS